MPEDPRKNFPTEMSFQDLHDIIEKAHIGIYTSTPQGRYIFVNPALAGIYGYATPEDLMVSITDIATQVYYDPADREEFKRLLETDGEVVNHECRMLRKDGTVFWVSMNARAVRDQNGNTPYYQGFTTDITERKLAEEELQNLNYEKSLVLENANEIIAFHDTELRLVWANNAYLRGISVVTETQSTLESVKGRKCYEAWGLQQGCSDCPVSLSIETGVPQQGELNPENQKHWPQIQGSWAIKAAPVRNAVGVVIGAIEIAEDITERKKAEEALAREKRLFKTIVDNIPVMITRYDPHMNMLYLNKEFNKIIGWKTEELQDIDLMEKVYPDPEYRREVMEYVEQAVQEWRELTLRTKSGGINFSEWSNIRLADGTQVGIGIDITQHKQAEEENRRIHSLLETAGRIARFGGWSVNLSDNKVYMSSQVAAMHEAPPDYTPTVEEAIAFYAPEWREKISEIFSRCATEGVPFDEELEILTFQNRRIWIRTTGEAIRDEAGVIRHVAGAFQDISQRKKVEEDLRASLEEKMVLLREIHHRVKNNLAILAALLEMQQEEVTDPAAAAVIRDLDTRIRSIALVHERLYQKGNLALIDFQDYLDSLLQDLRYSLAPGRDILCTARAQGISLGIDLALPCGMIINELVTNAIKYAFPDEKTNDGINRPEIYVEIQKDNGHYRIVVADNGVGFPGVLDLQTSQSFGLRLIRMIGTHQLGGKFELDRGKGTRITFIFKDRHKKKSLPEREY
jgi:PAS domain S-box-containing protein